MNFYSQIGQDRLVVKYSKEKRNGTFVDIGSGFPININNTFVLEKEYDWSGISIDLYLYSEKDGSKWNDNRKTKLIIKDALSIDYSTMFEENDLPKKIDYLSIDLEPPDLSLKCLFMIPFDEYIFNIITFEVDNLRGEYQDRIIKSRNFLQSKGYVLIGSLCNGQDDVYLHNSISHLIDEFQFQDENIIWTKF